MCPKLFTQEQLALVKIRVENVPDVATCHWRGDEDGTGRQRGRPRALARATSSASGNGVRRRQSDIRIFDRLVSRDSGVGGGGARRVNVNYCKLCQKSCGSELRLFRIHEMTCPKRFEASILESIKIHVSSPFLKVSHIWRGDQKSYRKMPKRVKRDRSKETSHNEPEKPPAKKKVKKRQSLITAFLQ